MRSLRTSSLALIVPILAGAGILGPGREARAQSAAAGGTPSVREVPPGAPTIAPPAPGAPPEKVEQAKVSAKTAELHPIVPSPQNPLRPAFQLYAELDIPVIGIGVVFAAARNFRAQTAFCGAGAAPKCDPASLNAIDRTTAGYWSPGWQTASDYGLYAVAVGATTLLVLDEGLAPGINDAVVVAETGLTATALASVMTLASSRPRPYMYGDKAPLSARNSPDAGLSFLSSHAAISFGIVTSTVVTMRRLHPASRAPWIVLGVGGALASFVASARVLGGMHFISDSVGGAFVGTSLGVLIPSLHASPVAIVPVTGDAGQRGLAFALRF
jgi:membrane-associated phospholipid phosphatase